MYPADDLKQLLRRLVRPVAVVTARWNGRSYAMAASAFSEVSLDPPSLLVCINRSSVIFEPLDAGVPLALNILAADHDDVLAACGGGVRGEERFAIGDWDREGTLPAPILRDACGVALLDQTQSIDHGTHRIIIGNVVRVIRPLERHPMAYFGGRTVTLSPQPTAA